MSPTSCEQCMHQPETGCAVTASGDLALAVACPGCAANCDICRNERFITTTDANGYQYLGPCRCKAAFDRIDAFNAAHIPARYCHCTLLTYEVKGGNQREIHQKVEKHLQGFHPKSPGLLLSGNVGTGKTHLMTAILRELTLKRGIRSRFVEFTHLLSDIKEGFSQRKSEAEVLGPISQIPVLGIDELGKGTATDWQISVLDEVISRRYNQQLTTYFTTNLPLDANQSVGESTNSSGLRKALEQVTVEDRVGPRIYSRLHEMARFLAVKGPDARRAASHP